VVAVMTARVCVLYKQSTSALILVCIGFILVRAFIIASIIVDGILPQEYAQDVLLGFPYCATRAPSMSLTLLYPVSAGSSLLFEIALLIMVAHRCLFHIRELRLEGSALRFRSVAQKIFEHGLLYFVGLVIWESLLLLSTLGLTRIVRSFIMPPPQSHCTFPLTALIALDLVLGHGSLCRSAKATWIR